ncbi:two-component system sensor histidine kinase UhpB [Azospirillum brasilense]|uniref:Oxygen sensor histidine kinase NreB n=1 Tax=Azospirillum brasilense TaxID=192 RepID=A0A560BB50_AZOBR|nr:ATP-binding protein [Azospirillum brasilense]TWA69871.1 two-component system sensor histidine kinase UhpB [Azospirillum brasilense]
MSLRMRMLALIGLFLALLAVAGAAVMIANARDAVRAEMASALDLGVAVGRAEAGRGAVPDAVAALDRLGLRHLRFVVGDAPADLAGGGEPDHPSVPGWFAALVGVAPQAQALSGPDGRVLLTVIAEPQDEVAEVWEDMRDLALAMLVVGLLLLGAAWVAVGRALAPLARIEAAVRRLRQGVYEPGPRDGLAGGGVPELARLGTGIAALAGELAAAGRENRRLGQRLIEAQDRERRDIAREIHDELGAALFAIKVDAGRILRLSEEPKPEASISERVEIAGRARAVLSMASDVHRLSRRILVRLRPSLLDQLPLGEALSGLIGEWARREPAVRWSLDVAGDDAPDGIDGLDEVLRLTVFRLAQESLVNALRHARPTRVSVTVRRRADRVEVVVADDGPGFAEGQSMETNESERGGLGISGMAERVRALGGTLSIGSDGGQGTRVAACLPCVPAGLESVA